MKRQAELQRLYGSEEANRRTIQDLGVCCALLTTMQFCSELLNNFTFTCPRSFLKDMLQKAEHVEVRHCCLEEYNHKERYNFFSTISACLAVVGAKESTTERL